MLDFGGVFLFFFSHGTHSSADSLRGSRLKSRRSFYHVAPGCNKLSVDSSWIDRSDRLICILNGLIRCFYKVDVFLGGRCGD